MSNENNYLNALKKSEYRYRTIFESVNIPLWEEDYSDLMEAFDRLIRSTVPFSLSGANVKYRVDIENGLWYGNIDDGQISQAINNILLNAAQAMPWGLKRGIILVKAENITIKKALELKLSKNLYVKISIQDQGNGIFKENLNKIFDPYFSTKIDGHGLGLSSALSSVKKHNGVIKVESRKDKGSIFMIYLPAVKTISDYKNNKNIAPVKKQKNEDITVIVMDDEDMVRDVIVQMLKLLGCKVIETKNGESTLEIFRKRKEKKQKIDIIIMDLTIPGGMGGKETNKKIRELDRNVKTIVISGYSNDPVMSQFSEFGFNNVLQKPFTMKQLQHVLETI